eukprot:6111616-Prymnesium_polylepis.2
MQDPSSQNHNLQACERQEKQKGEAQRRRRRHTGVRPSDEKTEELEGAELPRRHRGRGQKRRWWRCQWRQSSR